MTSPEASPRISLRDWALLLLLGAIWGGSFFFARVAVAEIHPLTLVLLRVAIAATALQIYLAIAGPPFLALFLPRIGRFLLLALFNNVIPFSLIFLGQTELGAGVASVMNATTPFWTILLACFVFRTERLRWNKAAGILLGIAGTAIMIGPGLVAGLGGPVWPKLALIGAALSYALALFAARGLRDAPPAIIAAGQLTASTLIMIPVVLIAGGMGGVASASPTAWAAILALALLSTAFAYLLFFRILASAGATNTSLVTLIVPASAILLGALFLGERLQVADFLGMAAIGMGLLTIDGRLFRRSRSLQPTKPAATGPRK